MHPEAAGRLTEKWNPYFAAEILRMAAKEKKAGTLLENLEILSAGMHMPILGLFLTFQRYGNQLLCNRARIVRLSVRVSQCLSPAQMGKPTQSYDIRYTYMLQIWS